MVIVMATCLQHRNHPSAATLSVPFLCLKYPSRQKIAAYLVSLPVTTADDQKVPLRNPARPLQKNSRQPHTPPPTTIPLSATNSFPTAAPLDRESLRDGGITHSRKKPK